jgi:hypothetical protein
MPVDPSILFRGPQAMGQPQGGFGINQALDMLMRKKAADTQAGQFAQTQSRLRENAAQSQANVDRAYTRQTAIDKQSQANTEREMAQEKAKDAETKLGREIVARGELALNMLPGSAARLEYQKKTAIMSNLLTPEEAANIPLADIDKVMTDVEETGKKCLTNFSKHHDASKCKLELDRKMAAAQAVLESMSGTQMDEKEVDARMLPAANISNRLGAMLTERDLGPIEAINAGLKAAAEAEHEGPTGVWKLVADYRKAIESDDPLMVSATYDALLEHLKSDGMLVITDAQGNAMIGTGPAGMDAIMDATRVRIETQLNAGEAMVAVGDRLLTVATEQAMGAAGAVQGFLQDVFEQKGAFEKLLDLEGEAGDAFRDLDSQVRQSIQRGQSDLPDHSDFFDSSIPATRALLIRFSYLVALVNNPDGRVSEPDFQSAKEQLRAKGAFSNLKSMRIAVGEALREQEATAIRLRKQLESTGRTESLTANLARDEAPGFLKDPKELTDEEYRNSSPAQRNRILELLRQNQQSQTGGP